MTRQGSSTPTCPSHLAGSSSSTPHAPFWQQLVDASLTCPVMSWLCRTRVFMAEHQAWWPPPCTTTHPLRAPPLQIIMLSGPDHRHFTTAEDLCEMEFVTCVSLICPHLSNSDLVFVCLLVIGSCGEWGEGGGCLYGVCATLRYRLHASTPP